jgi:hypothetical protein
MGKLQHAIMHIFEKQVVGPPEPISPLKEVRIPAPNSMAPGLHEGPVRGLIDLEQHMGSRHALISYVPDFRGFVIGVGGNHGCQSTFEEVGCLTWHIRPNQFEPYRQLERLHRGPQQIECFGRKRAQQKVLAV